MTGRIQEAGKGGVSQTRVLTRGTCCDQLVAIHIQTHFFFRRENALRIPPLLGGRKGVMWDFGREAPGTH